MFSRRKGHLAGRPSPWYGSVMAHPDPIPAELTPEDVAFLEAVRAGQASLDQGRSIPYELVRPWLLSWGTDNELPAPECP